MRNHRDNINNETAYFYTVIKNMNLKQKLKDTKINNNESLSDEIESICTCEDKYFCESSLSEWIEMIENADLHRALNSLSLEEQRTCNSCDDT